MKINALVLAGGKIKDYPEAGNKAFLPLGGKPMIEHVLEGLSKSRYVSDIAVTSLPAGEVLRKEGVRLIPAKKNFISSIAGALKKLPEEKTLLVASDIPLITSNIIDSFIEECSRIDADFYYPIIPKKAVVEKFPQMKRTFFTIKEGTFTGGNVIMVLNKRFLENTELAKQVYADRKRPHKLAKILGPKLIYKFIRKTLSLSEAEAKASEIINGRAKAIIFPFPEAGTDVDRKADYFKIQEIVRK